MLSVPTMVFEATTENASFGLVGSQRGWGNATPGRLINTILQHRIGNPVVVLDEVEKSGRATMGRITIQLRSLFYRSGLSEEIRDPFPCRVEEQIEALLV